ncbi:MAG: cytochrome P450, partial [Mycobacterium sp.]|nr:cytochrome P450 [Mycobacterium sp.]
THIGGGVPRRVEWVVDETLRLWPSGFIGRRATRDVDLAGWQVPARTEVMVALRALHLLAPGLVEPTEFRPGRWENARLERGGYVPFGGGAHRCFGARLGHAQMCAALVEILRRCRLTLVGEAAPANALSVLRPAECGLRVTPR